MSSLVYPYPHICQSECHSLLETAPHSPFPHTLIITLTCLKPAQSSPRNSSRYPRHWRNNIMIPHIIDSYCACHPIAVSLYESRTSSAPVQRGRGALEYSFDMNEQLLKTGWKKREFQLKFRKLLNCFFFHSLCHVYFQKKYKHRRFIDLETET